MIKKELHFNNNRDMYFYISLLLEEIKRLQKEIDDFDKHNIIKL